MPRKGTTRTYRCPADHSHRINCYQNHKCGCDRCVEANTVSAREGRKRAAYGRKREQRDPGPARDHLIALRAAGWTKAMLADATGMNAAHLQRIIARPPLWITPETEARILSATTVARRPEAFVRNIATARQLQGLHRHGFTLTYLAERLGKSVQHVWVLMRQEYVTEHTRRLVDDLTAELATVQPTGPQVARTIARARKHGFVSLYAWDDINSETETPKGDQKDAA